MPSDQGVTIGKLTKKEALHHRKACELLARPEPLSEIKLTEEELKHLTQGMPPDEAEAFFHPQFGLSEALAEFVLTHWNELISGTNSLEGAFFTPLGLAYDMRFHVHGDRVIDLCAGIGRLAWGCREKWVRSWERKPPREIVCVESNPAFVEVGRKVLPEATWIQGDVYDVLDMGLGRFDTAIANPPFKKTARKRGPRYRGSEMPYHVIDIAGSIADHGVFVVPQNLASFRYSGQRYYRDVRTSECQRFEAETGIRLEPNIGIDTTYHKGDWHGVAPHVEVVVCDFNEPLVGNV